MSKKKSDDEIGILISREMKSMMQDESLTKEQRFDILAAIMFDVIPENKLILSFANSLKVGYDRINSMRINAVVSHRESVRNYEKNAKKNNKQINKGLITTDINNHQQVSADISDYQQMAISLHSNAKHCNTIQDIPLNPPGGIDGNDEESSRSEPESILDDPESLVDSSPDQLAGDVEEIAGTIEGSGYPYKVNRGKLRKCLVSVLKKNSAAEVISGWDVWFCAWKSEDFRWAPSRITDWLYNCKYLETPRSDEPAHRDYGSEVVSEIV